MTPAGRDHLAKYGVTKPADVMTHRKFLWSDFLQAFLTTPSVAVSKLHPIMGLRIAALFVDLVNAGLASPDGPKSTVQILSAVRTKERQIWFWERDLRNHGGRASGGVANPYTVHRVDAEGVQRAGSNHMAQKQLEPWGVEVGYAVDLRTLRGTNDAAWKPIHDRLSTYGLDWPLKPGRNPIVERWHIEWFPRRDRAPLTGPIAWPARPGVHRPIIRGMVGADVVTLQTQSARLLGRAIIKPGHKGARPAGAVMADGIAGPATVKLFNQAETKLGRNPSKAWSEKDQNAFDVHATKPDPPSPPPTTTVSPPPADAAHAKQLLVRAERAAKATLTAIQDAKASL